MSEPAMTCVLCSLALTQAWFTYDSCGPFCESCHQFFKWEREFLFLRWQHDHMTGQLAWPWAYSLKGLKKVEKGVTVEEVAWLEKEGWSL